MLVTKINTIGPKKLQKNTKNIIYVEYYVCHKKKHYTNKYLEKKSKKLALVTTTSTLIRIVSIKVILI